MADENRKFGTIYADPPWHYSNAASRGAAENHYETMSTDAIAALPVARLAADEAHLHLWTTNAFLFEAERVIKAWGFTYKSCLLWIKPQIGNGNYWRVSHEFLLLGVRGNLTFPDRTQQSWLFADRGRHSAKPNVFRKLIEQVSPSPPPRTFRSCPGRWMDDLGRPDSTRPLRRLVERTNVVSNFKMVMNIEDGAAESHRADAQPARVAAFRQLLNHQTGR